MLAVICDHLDVVSYLQEAGADCDVRDRVGSACCYMEADADCHDKDYLCCK